MRPHRSIFGPLVLIGIGVLFLARNIIPDIPVFELFSRYWPFLLIAWGGLRLIEVLFWAATSKPLPGAGVAGGEWFLIVLICLFGSGMYAVRHLRNQVPTRFTNGAGLEVFGESFDYSLSGEKQVGKTPKIVLESFRGNARITGAETDQVKV